MTGRNNFASKIGANFRGLIQGLVVRPAKLACVLMMCACIACLLSIVYLIGGERDLNVFLDELL